MQKFKPLLDYHFLFLYIGIVFGLLMVYVNPPWQTNDEDRHFYYAYGLSNFKIKPEIRDGNVGMIIPESIVKDVNSFQVIKFSDSIKIKRKNLSDLKSHKLNASKLIFYENTGVTSCPVGYIPSAIFIKLAILANLSPIDVGYWARIGSLIAYLLIVFIAIKKIPVYKGFLMVVALSPMALYQGASITYDSLSFALVFLMFSYIILFYVQDKKITLNQILVFFLICTIHRAVKDGYLFLYFLPLCIGISKFEKTSYYFYFLLLLCLAAYLPGKIWNMYISNLNLPENSGLQRDFRFDPMLNLKFQLTHPLDLANNIVNNIFNQSNIWIKGSIGRFGYSYTALPGFVVFLVVFTMILAVMFEDVEKTRMTLTFRILIISLTILNAFAIIGGFYLLSPVGASVIFGLQGRYFTPLLPFIFTMLFYFPIKFDNKKIYYIIFTIIFPVLFLIYTMYFLNTTFFVS